MDDSPGFDFLFLVVDPRNGFADFVLERHFGEIPASRQISGVAEPGMLGVDGAAGKQNAPRTNVQIAEEEEEEEEEEEQKEEEEMKGKAV